MFLLVWSMVLEARSVSARSKGTMAENMASQWLRQKKFVILARNFRINGVEIDILTRYFYQGEWHTILFEIKKMRRSHFLAGYPALGHRQLQRYQKALQEMVLRSGKLLNAHVGLIVFSEKGDILLFNPFFL